MFAVWSCVLVFGAVFTVWSCVYFLELCLLLGAVFTVWSCVLMSEGLFFMFGALF